VSGFNAHMIIANLWLAASWFSTGWEALAALLLGLLWIVSGGIIAWVEHGAREQG
jgi:hypothetical protein